MSGSLGGGAGAGEVVRQGHLKKLKTMKKKYFVLRGESVEGGARLEYYESEKKFRAGAAPRRVLALTSCYNIMRRLDLKQRHVIALFTRDEQFCIVADNEPELHAWLAAILKHHRSDDASADLRHPIRLTIELGTHLDLTSFVVEVNYQIIEHVWQVNVQKKGLGAVKNIHGLYNLCLTDKTLTLVKIKSHNNVISELGIPERVEYTLKNIRRCGDSECFFYMEVGRQTTTGAGELWMLSEDSNIAQSMHSTIYHAMRNCAKETENERDHIVLPKGEGLPARRQTYSDGRGRAGLTSEKVLCVGACIRQCVCSATYSIDDSAALAPDLAHEYQQNNTLTDKPEGARVIKHHRTVSLPTGCPSFQEPLKIFHERTRSAPLTGEEVEKVVEKALHSSCKAVNGTEKKSQSRRASTGMRLSKLSPAHSKNAGTLRNRCDSMPSRACSAFEIERPPPRHNDLEGLEVSRDEPDAVAEWYRTPRIPEEPDVCDISKDLMNLSVISSGNSIHHSRTSSLGVEEADTEGYLRMHTLDASEHAPLEHAAGRVSSSGSVCSGTPSTDPRFSEYTLEPATTVLGGEWRPPRAYSVGSRPAPRAGPERSRAYSVGARARPHPPAPSHASHTGDLMLLDFSQDSAYKTQVQSVPRTPPSGVPPQRPRTDEYVDMSPRAGGYVLMTPGDKHPPPAPAPAPATPDGYVEMSFGRAHTRPIAIATTRAPPPPPVATSPEHRLSGGRTSHGSQIFEFSGSLESPLSPPSPPHSDTLDNDALLTPTEDNTPTEVKSEPVLVVGAEKPARPPAEVSCSPSYVTLKPLGEESHALASQLSTDSTAESTAAVVVAGASGAARFSVCAPGTFTCTPLHYAALDLEPRRTQPAAPPRHYTQIDFLRSEKLAYDAT